MMKLYENVCNWGINWGRKSAKKETAGSEMK